MHPLISKYFTDLTPDQCRQIEALDALYRDWNDKINVISRKDIDKMVESVKVFGAKGLVWIRKESDEIKSSVNKFFSQEELAARIGTNKSYISRVETGRTEPKVSTFYRIIAALGLTVELTPAV